LNPDLFLRIDLSSTQFSYRNDSDLLFYDARAPLRVLKIPSSNIALFAVFHLKMRRWKS